MSKQQRSETIETEADADATERTLSDLRQASQRWKGEREGIAADRANRLVAGDKAEADRLGVKLSMGDKDDADRLEIVGALTRRLTAWQAQATERQRRETELALARATQAGRDAEDALAEATLTMIAALGDLEDAREAMKAVSRAAGKAGITIDVRWPGEGRRLIHSALQSGRSAPDMVANWLERARAEPVRRQRTPPARRNYTPPPRARNTGDAAEYFGDQLASKFRVATIGNNEAA